MTKEGGNENRGDYTGGKGEDNVRQLLDISYQSPSRFLTQEV